MVQPAVTIVILNWNGPEETLQCLESVRELDYPRFEVIVVDNGSQDDSRNRIRQWALEHGDEFSFREILQGVTPADPPAPSGRIPLELICTGKNLGFCGGNNLAILHRLSRGDPPQYFLFLNNDARVHPHCLKVLVEVAEKSDAGIVGALVLGSDSRLQASPSPCRYRERLWVNGAAMLIRKDVLERIYTHTRRYFDEELFLYGEEIDLCLWARRLGFRVVQAKGALVFHKRAQSSGGRFSPVSYYYSTRNRIVVFDRFLSQPLKAFFHFSNLFLCLAQILRNLVALRPRAARAILCGIRDAYRRALGKWKDHDREVFRLRPSPQSLP